MNKNYKFFGFDNCNVKPFNNVFDFVKNPIKLYEMLSNIWCEYSCAPRMRDEWNKNNKTKGQCSITSFLVQDIFGGEVYGVELNDGNFHCYNVVGSAVFDLTSEQFGDVKLEYNLQNLQKRETHFAKEEKYNRYLYLKSKLLELYGNK